MDLLFFDFMKEDPSKNGKENILVMTDPFSKFSIVVVKPNQKVKMVAKPWLPSGFILMEFQPESTVIRGKVLTNT